MKRLGLGAANAVAVVVATAWGASAWAAEPITIDTIPTFSTAEIAKSVVTLDRDKAVITLAPKVEEVAVKKADQVTLNSDVLFDFGKAELTATAKAKIGDLMKDIAQGKGLTVTGHTDSIGSDADNLTLSKARAQAVADAIAAARPDLVLTVDGKGESEPVAPNEKGGEDDPDGRALNRRVEVKVSG